MGFDFSKVLKLAARGAADSFRNIYNTSIHSGKWPAAWKQWEWTPVFKRDDRLEYKNYRPITVLITVDKVFEQLLSDQVLCYLTRSRSLILIVVLLILYLYFRYLRLLEEFFYNFSLARSFSIIVQLIILLILYFRSCQIVRIATLFTLIIY